jgi:hypothetical protein
MDEAAARRKLQFFNLDAVVGDVEALRAGGYERVGRWDLAQVCGHLADWMRFPLDGFPKSPLPVRLMLWAARNTIGRRELRKLLESKSMTSGNPTLRDTVPAPGGDEDAAVERLRMAVAQFQSHTGPLYPSPIFGQIDRETLTQLQLIHCAHHLSFLVPKKPQASLSASDGPTQPSAV